MRRRIHRRRSLSSLRAFHRWVAPVKLSVKVPSEVSHSPSDLFRRLWLRLCSFSDASHLGLDFGFLGLGSAGRIYVLAFHLNILLYFNLSLLIFTYIWPWRAVGGLCDGPGVIGGALSEALALVGCQRSTSATHS